MFDLWKIVLLFVVLTPGVLLTIPPVGKKIFGSGKSSLTAACVHAVIFVVLLNLFNIEGFQIMSSQALTSRPISYQAELCRGMKCPTTHSCVNGRCNQQCGKGTKGCDHNYVCVNGTCSQICDGKVCRSDQGCVNKQCLTRCAGKICQLNEECVKNICTPPPPPPPPPSVGVRCGKVVCGPTQRCLNLRCVAKVPGVPCGKLTFCYSPQQCVNGKCITPRGTSSTKSLTMGYGSPESEDPTDYSPMIVNRPSSGSSIVNTVLKAVGLKPTGPPRNSMYGMAYGP
jgi:hypothetical protein